MSFISLPLAKIIAFPAYLLIEYLTAIIQLTAKLPYASISINWFSKPLLILYFLILIVILVRKWSRIGKIEEHIRKLQSQTEHRALQTIQRQAQFGFSNQ